MMIFPSNIVQVQSDSTILTKCELNDYDSMKNGKTIISKTLTSDPISLAKGFDINDQCELRLIDYSKVTNGTLTLTAVDDGDRNLFKHFTLQIQVKNNQSDPTIDNKCNQTYIQSFYQIEENSNPTSIDLQSAKDENERFTIETVFPDFAEDSFRIRRQKLYVTNSIGRDIISFFKSSKYIQLAIRDKITNL